MGLSTTTTIFLFVICLCGGIVIGAMFSRMRKVAPAAPPAEDKAEAEPAAPAPSLARSGETEVLRAWRDESDQVWLEMDGQRLESRQAMAGSQLKRLLKLVLDLRPWLDALPPAPVRTSAPERVSAPVPAPVQAPISEDLFQPLPEPIRKPSIFSSRPPKSAKADDKPAVNLKSIVAQIDDVLQEKLTSTVFAGQDIHLLEGATGEVMVQIGPTRHPGVEAVPNPEIQALIRQAVAEWDAKPK